MPLVLDGSSGVTFPVAAGSTSTVQSSSGKILQVVSTTKTDVFSSSSSSFVDVTGLSLTITPTSVNSKIYVILTSSTTCNTTGQPFYVNLVRNSTTIAQPATTPAYYATVMPYINQADIQIPWSLSYVDSPATTSSTTYKIQAKSGGTWYINGGRSAGDFVQTTTMVIMEIAA